MYKIASANAQRGREHHSLADLTTPGITQSDLTPEAERAALVRRLSWLEAEASRVTGDKRKKLGREKLAVQNRLSELKAVLRSRAPRSTADCFVDVLKETLPRAQFNAYWAAARRMASEREERDGAK